MRYIRLGELDLPQNIIDRLKLLNVSNLIDLFLLPTNLIMSCAMFTVVESNELFFLLDDFSFADNRYTDLYNLAFGRLFSDKALNSHLLQQLDITTRLGDDEIIRLAALARSLANSTNEEETEKSKVPSSHAAALQNLLNTGFSIPDRRGRIIGTM